MGMTRRWTESGVPVLSAEEREAMRAFYEIQERHNAELQATLLEATATHPIFGPMVKAMSPAMIEEQNRRSQSLLRAALVENNWEPYVQDARAQGSNYARMGIPFADWFDLLGFYQARVLPKLFEGRTVAEAETAVFGMETYIGLAMGLIGDAYLQTKQHIITQQESALRELSTPVLQIRDRMLLLPIIGVIDSQRALQLTQQLLIAVRTHRAKVAVMDITGVAAVDSKVANHLLQTVAAARLMGARVIVTGLSAEVAHSLVVLGVDTSQLRTTGDLQTGIEEADELLGYRVQRRDDGAGTQG